MIDAIDLRIGNWVDIPGKGFHRISNGQDIDSVIVKDAKPIPITTELLIKMGFEKRGSTDIYDIKAHNFAYHTGVNRVTIFHPGNQYWHWLGTHINYVHQIQNLFYCIVGKDLSIN